MIIGAALTSAEMSGVAHAAQWRRWIEKGRAPAAGDGAGFDATWRDDLAQLASLGVTELMLTLEWSRLWPTPDTPIPESIEFHRNLASEAAALGMAPWFCLVDGTLPGWFAEDEGGFVDARSRNLLWPRHVDWIGETFGDLAAGWVPLREPVQWAMWSHLLGAAPPGKQRRRDALAAVKSSLEAELHAWRLLRGGAPVATFQTARTIHAEPDDVKARPHADWLDEAVNQLWLRSLTDGPGREAFDRVVVQLRSAVRVDGDGVWSDHAPDRTVETGMEALERVLDSTGDRVVIAAADLQGVALDGEARSDRLRALLDGTAGLGADGWWQTSPIDGWHWLAGFDAEPGVIDRDRNERDVAETLRRAGGGEAAAQSSAEAQTPRPR